MSAQAAIRAVELPLFLIRGSVPLRSFSCGLGLNSFGGTLWPRSLDANMVDEVHNTAPPLPAEGFLRQRQILGDKNANPPIPPVVPIGKTAWWAGVKSGRYPKPVKLGPRTTAWKVSDIRALLDRVAGKGVA